MDVAEGAQTPDTPIFGSLPGEQIEHHRRPTGPAAPSPIEQKGADDFSDEVMQGCPGKDTHEQVEEKTLDLHVFPVDESQEDEHIGCDQDLAYPASPEYVLSWQGTVQEDAKPDRRPDKAEVEQEKDLTGCQITPDADADEDGQKYQG